MIHKVFLYLWIASTLVFFFASTYSEAPNQIIWSYNIALFAMAVLLLQSRNFVSSGVGELCILIFLYFLAYYLVSFWEVFPGTTIEHGKFELIFIIIAINGYLIGRNLQQDLTIAAHAQLAALIILITIIQMYLDPDQERYGYGLQLMLCLPAAMLLRQYVLVMVGVVLMLASLHKTPLVAAVLAIGIVGFMSRRGAHWLHGGSGTPDELATRPREDPFLEASFFILAIIIGGACIGVYFTEITWTIGRFLPEGSLSMFGVTVEAEGTDPSREYVTVNTLMLLPQYYVQGMGYMNFQVWSGADTGDHYVNRLGRLVSGTNIHNSYMTWILEGGILAATIVAVLLYRSIKKVWHMIANKPSRPIGILLLSWCAAVLVSAAFHQMHSTMQFWGMIGMIFGCHERLFSKRRVALLPRPR